MIFYGKVYMYSNKVPKVSEMDIHVFSSSKKKMLFEMKHHGVNQISNKLLLKDVAKIYTQYRLLKAVEEFGIIANVAKK